MNRDTESSNEFSVVQNKDELLISLQNILKVFLNENSNYGELRNASVELFDLFSCITNIKDNSDNPVEINPIFLGCGKAVSPLDAARCIRECARTTKFLRGIYEGIKEAQLRFPGKTIHALYAGCGPCAPFAVTMAALFPSNQIQFTLLDINEYSLKNARKIVELLGFQNSIREYICCDASLYKHPKEDEIHMIISETMLNALQKEPQVAITGNLVPQMRNGGILIPQKITVSACLARRDKENFSIPGGAEDNEYKLPEDFRLRINPAIIFELSAENPHTINLPTNGDGVFLKPPVTFSFAVPEDGKYYIMLNTFITVFEKHTLGDYDSSITMPLFLKEPLHPGENKCYEFSYYIGKQPGFKYREIQG